jgi:nitroimidazol reductase NimA-like FMN-containing flavoprotein (pyridoxamine 5'-phosphate oxidase superfamily)
MTSITKPTHPRHKVRRVPRNARYDRDSIYRVLDRGLVAHVSFSHDGHPFCIPTLYARVGDRVLIHGSTASRMTRVLAAGAQACLTVTLLDGLVLARSIFETGANYDSAVLLGRFRPIAGDEQKLEALKAFVDAVLPGRWSEVRPPSRQELKGTAILELAIDEASVKTKSGGPDDDDSPDAELNTWAGVVPIVTSYGPPQPSPALRAGIPLAASVTRLLAGTPRPSTQRNHDTSIGGIR